MSPDVIPPLRVGILGCSGISYAHAKGCNLSKNVELIAACDLNKQLLDKFVNAHPGIIPFTSSDEFLKSKDLDIVIIATPDETHAEIAISAAENAKHMIIEKPFATSLEEANSIIAAVKANGVKAMCGQSMRFLPKILKAKEIIENGKIGRPVFARMVTPSSPFWSENSWAKFKDKRGQEWLLVHNGMHNFDCLSWLFESVPVSLYAVTHAGQADAADWLNVHEFISVNMRFENGGIAISEENRIMQPSGYPYHFELYIVGTKGTIDLSDKICNSTSIWNKDGIDFPSAQVNYLDYNHPMATQVDVLAKSIFNDTTPLIPLEFSIRIIEALFSAVKSCKTGQPERILYV